MKASERAGRSERGNLGAILRTEPVRPHVGRTKRDAWGDHGAIPEYRGRRRYQAMLTACEGDGDHGEQIAEILRRGEREFSRSVTKVLVGDQRARFQKS